MQLLRISHIIAFTLVFKTLVIFAHPVHISITNLDYYPDSGLFELSTQLNTEDFRQIINAQYGMHTDFNHTHRLSTRQQIAISDFFNKHIRIQVDTVQYPLLFKEWGYDEENISFYFTFNIQKIPLEMKISNTLFIDIFTDQVNMFIYQYKRKQKGLVFDRRNTVYTITFE